MSIEFTQYLRPDGRARQIRIDRPREIEQLARCLSQRGIIFEAEVLIGDVVSLSARHSDDDEDELAILIVENGPGIPDAVDELIREANDKLK